MDQECFCAHKLNLETRLDPCQELNLEPDSLEVHDNHSASKTYLSKWLAIVHFYIKMFKEHKGVIYQNNFDRHKLKLMELMKFFYLMLCVTNV